MPTLLRPATLGVAALLVLTGCSSSTGDDATPGHSPTAVETATVGPTETTEPTPDAATTAPEEASTEPSAADPAGTDLVLTVDGEETVLEPTDVYCHGSEGDIRHIIGKTNNRPPLVEADGTHFAMVKLENHGAPYRAEQPSGISHGNDSVTFDEVALGSAVLDGTMVCTTWEH